MKVGVLASGAGTNLQAILDRVHGREGVEVVAVASDQPGAPALDRAARAGVPTGVFPVEEDRRARDAAIADFLERHGVELVVLAGYMALLDPAFLGRFPGRVINVHPALLPAFPGAHAVRDALAAGVPVTGATVHLVDAGVDTGPVLAQREVRVLPDDDEDRLHERIKTVERELLVETVARLVTTSSAHPRENAR